MPYLTLHLPGFLRLKTGKWNQSEQMELTINQENISHVLGGIVAVVVFFWGVASAITKWGAPIYIRLAERIRERGKAEGVRQADVSWIKKSVDTLSSAIDHLKDEVTQNAQHQAEVIEHLRAEVHEERITIVRKCKEMISDVEDICDENVEELHSTTERVRILEDNQQELLEKQKAHEAEFKEFKKDLSEKLGPISGMAKQVESIADTQKIIVEHLIKNNGKE